MKKKRREIWLIEIVITNQDLLNNVENEKMRKYDLLANKLGLIYKCKTKIIPYVMTRYGVVLTYHKKYMESIGIPQNVEAYIQTWVLKKILEIVSFERRRGSGTDGGGEVDTEKAVARVKVQELRNIQ